MLLDLGLPGMSGLDVARALRQSPDTATTHLLALTGWGSVEDREQTRGAGFDGHLTKPTDPEALRKLLLDVSGRTASSGDKSSWQAGSVTRT